MVVGNRAGILFVTLLGGVVAAVGQQTAPAHAAADAAIHLTVAVTDKPGTPVAGLEQQDFTLLDNGTPERIASFKAVSGGHGPVEVILMLDAVNAPFSTMAFARLEVQKFLKANGRRMAHPTTIAILTDKGTEIEQGFSTDGNLLSSVLDHDTTGLRAITRASGYWGATEKLQISLGAVDQLAAFSTKLPGRKVILWISPGWPLLSGVREDLQAKEQEQIFSEVVKYSTKLRQANVTLYDVNPVGAGESLIHADYYREFVKGVRNPGQTQVGDLGLQVLAVQSGGLTLESNNDIAASIEKSLTDLDSWYEVTIAAPPAEKPNEYHHIEIKLDKPGLIARTRDGYYAQPEPRP